MRKNLNAGDKIRVSFEGTVVTPYHSGHYSCHKIQDTNNNIHYVYVDGPGVKTELVAPSFSPLQGEVYKVFPSASNRDGLSSTWFVANTPSYSGLRLTSSSGKVLTVGAFRTTYVNNDRWTVNKAKVS